jgi:hypothetical protein
MKVFNAFTHNGIIYKISDSDKIPELEDILADISDVSSLNKQELWDCVRESEFNLNGISLKMIKKHMNDLDWLEYVERVGSV